MGWHISIMTLFTTIYMIAYSIAFNTHAFSQNLPDANAFSDNDNLETEEMTAIENLEDEKLKEIGQILEQILLMPWPKGVSPLLYVENYSREDEPEINENNLDEFDIAPKKRSRYYRKYPWKRQNARYDAENRYLCQPSKDDVFRLLVALHEARQGNRGKQINFCNRKRPAGAIFTNIRFMGK
ncbi:uncharacterized protein LOC109596369 [Aethina tumida]|uniref:uncharacterized protein LOC109596369 n=1 Tax=Aethina tumida TaxID=116153 RepID=UPI0021495F07|nr:uncharacterized protein LOC109596369 [Aethina tumida]